MRPRACFHWDDAVGLVPFVHDVALQVPAEVSVIYVDHAVLGALGVVVILDVSGAPVVLVVPVLLDVLGVVAAPGVLVVLGAVDVLGVHDIHVFGVPGIAGTVPPAKFHLLSLPPVTVVAMA